MFCVESLISCILLLGAYLHEHTLEFISFGTNQIEKSSKYWTSKRLYLNLWNQVYSVSTHLQGKEVYLACHRDIRFGKKNFFLQKLKGAQLLYFVPWIAEFFVFFKNPSPNVILVSALLLLKKELFGNEKDCNQLEKNVHSINSHTIVVLRRIERLNFNRY